MTEDPTIQRSTGYGPTATPGGGEPPTPIGAHFKMVFISVLVLESILIVATVMMAVLIKQPTPAVEDVMVNCRMLATTGFGAICGLIGGKAVT